MQNYRIVGRVGEGAFGEVLRAVDLRSGESVALKKVFVRGGGGGGGLPAGVWREGMCLRAAGHANVLALREVFPHGAALVLATELLHCSLADVLSTAPAPLPEARAKAYAQGLLRALAHLHSLTLVHRDVKPANLLLSRGGGVKLGDFGLGRTTVEGGREYSYQAATRWYRSPEMLYSAKTYGVEVDIWSAGCVLAELLTLTPLFPGETDIDQLQRVLAVRGTPDVWGEDWPGVQHTPDFDKISFGQMPAVPLGPLLPSASAEALDLAEGLLQVPPKRRPPAAGALMHAWFLSPPLPALLSAYALPADKPPKPTQEDFEVPPAGAMLADAARA